MNMTNNEIHNSWKQSKQREKQISVLAQLNGTTTDNIRSIIISFEGSDVFKQKKVSTQDSKTKKRGAYLKIESIQEKTEQCLREGLNVNEAAEKLNIDINGSDSGFYQYYFKIRRQLVKAGVDLPEMNKTSQSREQSISRGKDEDTEIAEEINTVINGHSSLIDLGIVTESVSVKTDVIPNEKKALTAKVHVKPIVSESAPVVEEKEGINTSTSKDTVAVEGSVKSNIGHNYSILEAEFKEKESAYLEAKKALYTAESEYLAIKARYDKATKAINDLLDALA